LESSITNVISNGIRSELGLEAGDWVSLLEVSHELGEVDDALDWHGIVHGDPDGWVASMGLDLDDASLGSLGLELGLELFVATSYSKYDVDSASVGLVGDL